MPYTCHPLLALVKEVILVSRCIGLDTHILDIIQVLEDENLSEVFLVGHSYGGLVIGGSADKIPQRIRHLVYLDAYIPQDNKSVFDLEPGLETIYTKRTLKKRGIEWLVSSYKPEEFGVCDRIDIYWRTQDYYLCHGTPIINQ